MLLVCTFSTTPSSHGRFGAREANAGVMAPRLFLTALPNADGRSAFADRRERAPSYLHRDNGLSPAPVHGSACRQANGAACTNHLYQGMVEGGGRATHADGLGRAPVRRTGRLELKPPYGTTCCWRLSDRPCTKECECRIGSWDDQVRFLMVMLLLH